MPTSPMTVIGSRVCASMVSLPPDSGKFLSVIEKHVALARGVKIRPVLMRGSMILPYRVSTQCSVVSTDVHPATTSVAASSANELRIFSYLDLNGRGGWTAVRCALSRSRAPQEWDYWHRVFSLRCDRAGREWDSMHRLGEARRVRPRACSPGANRHESRAGAHCLRARDRHRREKGARHCHGQ